MKTLRTTDGQLILIDESEYIIASKYEWQSKSDGRGGQRPVTYIDGKRISFTSIVFRLDKNQIIYHKNGNPYDFRKSQIIICDKSEFGHLIGSTNRKLSQFKGVYYYERSNAWGVRIIKNKEIIEGGHFNSEEDASIVADYFIIKNFNVDSERNYPYLSFQQIEEKYNTILMKYGKNSNERRAKSGQGLVRCCNKTSKYMGVSRDKNKWTARIKYDKKQMYLGNFDIEEEAAKAYDKKAIELYGEFAKLNFSQ